MNQNYSAQPGSSISTKNVVAAIGAIICSISAFCMTFLPMVSYEGVSYFLSQEGTYEAENLYQVWGFSSFGKKRFENVYEMLDHAGRSGEHFLTIEIFRIVLAYVSTAAFITLLLAVIFVAVCKLTSLKSGKRALAGVFSIIALVMTAMMLATIIILVIVINKNMEAKGSVGPGPILMTVFAVGTVVFSFISKPRRKVNTPPAAFVPPQQQGFNPPPQQGMYPPQNAGYNPYAAVPPVQNIPVQNADIQNNNAFVSQQPVQVPPPDIQPIPQAVPQGIDSDLDDDPPTVAQIGAIEGVKGDYASAVINMRPGEKLIIGRDPTCCNIVISSDKKDISRTHCSVKYDPYTDSFKVIDMSSNGTFVNGTRLTRDQEAQFSAGTVISLGSGENQFRLKKI